MKYDTKQWDELRSQKNHYLSILLANCTFAQVIKSPSGQHFKLNFIKVQSITKSQLALRNGQDKPEIWVAYKGVVYDVTHSRLWRHGKHYEHWAGQDLTDELKDAPHTEAVFERMDVVGVLV